MVILLDQLDVDADLLEEASHHHRYARRVDSCEISLRPPELRFRTATPAANRELAKPEIMSHILMRSGPVTP